MHNVIFTDNANQKDLLIINQHGGSPHFKFPDEIQKAFDTLGQPFRDFLELERDVGATELAQTIFDLSCRMGLRVARIDCPAPRAIVDINRRPHLSSSVELPPALQAQVEIIHRATTKEILDCIRETHPRIVLDVHTMSPIAPALSPKLSLEDARSFSAHVDAWNFAARTISQSSTAGRRPTCIIDSLNTHEMIGNHRLSDELNEAFNAPGNPVTHAERNKPFAPTSERHQGQLFIGDGRGVAVDINKNDLTDTPLSGIDMAHLQLSDAKVHFIARLITNSIAKVLHH